MNLNLKLLSITGVFTLALGCTRLVPELNTPNTKPNERTKLNPEASDDVALKGLISCAKSVLTIGIPAATELDDAQAKTKTQIKTECRVVDLRDSDGDVEPASASLSSSNSSCQAFLDSVANRTKLDIDGNKKIKIKTEVYFRELQELLPDQCPVTVSVKDVDDRELTGKKGEFTIAKTTLERRLALLAPREVEVISSTSSGEQLQQIFSVNISGPDKDYNYNISDHAEDFECSDDATVDDASKTYEETCEALGLVVDGRNGLVSIDLVKSHTFLGGAPQKIAKIKIAAETNEGFHLDTREIKILVKSALFSPTITEIAGNLTCVLAADSSEKIARLTSFESRRDNESSYAKIADGESYALQAGDDLKQIRCVVVADKRDAGLSVQAKLVSGSFSQIDQVLKEKFRSSYEASAADDADTQARKGMALMKIRQTRGVIQQHPMDPRNSSKIGLNEAAGQDPIETIGPRISLNLINQTGEQEEAETQIRASAGLWGNVLFVDPSFSTRGTGTNHGNFGEDDDSARGSWSCASCHSFEYAYGASRVQSIGAGGVGFADNRIADPTLDLENSSHIDAPPVRSPLVMNVAGNAGGMFHNQRAGGRRDCGDASVIVKWEADGLASVNEGSRKILVGLDQADAGELSDPKSRHSAYSSERKCPNTQNVEQWIAEGEGNSSMKIGLLGFEGVEQQAMMAIGEHRFSVNSNTADTSLTLDEVKTSTDSDLAHWSQKRAWQRTTAEIDGAFSPDAFTELEALPAGSLLTGCNGKESTFEATAGERIQDGDVIKLCTLGEIIRCDGRVGADATDKAACPTGYLVTTAPGKLAIDGNGFIQVNPLNITFAIRGDKASGLTSNGRRPEDGDAGIQDELVAETVDQFRRRIKVGLIIAQWERMATTKEAPFQNYITELDKASNSVPANLNKDLSHKAKRGAVIFVESCSNCHNGQDLGGDVSSEANFGLADLQEFYAGKIDIPHNGPVGSRTLIGRAGATGADADRWKKKAPSLYNIQDHPAMGHGSSITTIKGIIAYKVAVLNDKSKRQKSDEELNAAEISGSDYEASMVNIGSGAGDAPQSMADLSAEQIDDVAYFVKVSLMDTGLGRFNFQRHDNAMPIGLREPGDDGSRQNANPFVCPESDDDESRYQLQGVRSRDGDDLRGCRDGRTMYQ